MDIETIRAKVKVGNYIISFTHTEKMRARKIEAEEIEESIHKEWEEDWATRKKRD